jgi:hypothetical protein
MSAIALTKAQPTIAADACMVIGHCCEQLA